MPSNQTTTCFKCGTIFGEGLSWCKGLRCSPNTSTTPGDPYKRIAGPITYGPGVCPVCEYKNTVGNTEVEPKYVSTFM